MVLSQQQLLIGCIRITARISRAQNKAPLNRIDVTKDRNRRGFALVAALWLTVAIAVIALLISSASRMHRLATANALEGARARAAAESGIEHARSILARMLDEGGSRRAWRDPARLLDPWSDLGAIALDSVAFGTVGQWYRVALTDLGVRLNVNRADAAQLRRFLAAHRVDAAAADRLAQAILDWRDPDDLRRVGGAEREDYLRAGVATLPSNAPFADVDELRHVAGMTPALLARLRGVLAVAGSGQTNINAAGRELLLSLPGLNEAAVSAIIRAQQARTRIATFQDLADLMPLAARESMQRDVAALLPLLAFETREVGVTSEGRVSGSPVRATGSAVIARGGRFAFVAWRQVR